VRLDEAIDAQRAADLGAQAAFSLMSVAPNEQMKRLAYSRHDCRADDDRGIYGMNFDVMPELRWSYGYYASLVTMGLACAGLYIGFKRSGWL
jgi:magnesium transporter